MPELLVPEVAALPATELGIRGLRSSQEGRGATALLQEVRRARPEVGTRIVESRQRATGVLGLRFLSCGEVYLRPEELALAVILGESGGQTYLRALET